MIPLHLADIRVYHNHFFTKYNALRNLQNYLKLQTKKRKKLHFIKLIKKKP